MIRPFRLGSAPLNSSDTWYSNDVLMSTKMSYCLFFFMKIFFFNLIYEKIPGSDGNHAIRSRGSWQCSSCKTCPAHARRCDNMVKLTFGKNILWIKNVI